MSTGSAAIPLLKAAPEPDQIADRLAGGDWRGLELCLAAHHVATTRRWSGRSRSSAALGELAVTAEAPVAGRAARSCASTGSTTRRGAASSAARASRPTSARPCSPSTCSRRMTPDEFRAAQPARRGAIERVPALLRRRVPRPRRHAADRERPADPAHAHRRRLPLARRRALARPPRVARARARAGLHLRHLPRRALPHFVAGYPSLFGLASDESSSSSATSRSWGRRPRSHTSPTRTACSARACPTAPASSTSTPSCAGSASSCPTSSRRSTSPTRRARRT